MFKIGDRVRVFRRTCGANPCIECETTFERVGTIEAINGVIARLSGLEFSVNLAQLEFAEEPEDNNPLPLPG